MFDKSSFHLCKFGLVLFPVFAWVEVCAEQSESKAKNSTTSDGSNRKALSREIWTELARALAKFVRRNITFFMLPCFFVISTISVMILRAKAPVNCGASFKIRNNSQDEVKNVKGDPNSSLFWRARIFWKVCEPTMSTHLTGFFIGGSKVFARVKVPTRIKCLAFLGTRMTMRSFIK